MVFSSSIFLYGFLPLFFLGYFCMPKTFKNIWALLGSLVFYAWGGPLFVFVLIASSTIDFLLAKTFHRNHRKLFLSIGIVINVALLAYFKYINFAIDNANLILHSLGFDAIQWTKVVLPIGISFFTFQKISYLVDVYRGVRPAVKHWHDHQLFVILFPQLIAGPIVRYVDIADELIVRKESNELRVLGFARFAVGLAKKVLIANTLGAVADPIFAKEMVNGGEAWFAMVNYTFQIYYDFAGYSDMAIGLGMMMGFRFPENFNFPYLSSSITEFWRRWHITLGSWMRDYLYIPFGGNRKGNVRTYINLFATFLISGLWHGASWNFVIWGAYHGVWLVLERLFLLRWMDRIPRPIRIFINFIVVLFGWVFFRIEEFDKAMQWIKAMFHPVDFDRPGEYSYYALLVFAILASLWTYGKKAVERELAIFHQYSKQKGIWFPILSVLLIYLVSISIVSSNYNPFIYFRF